MKYLDKFLQEGDLAPNIREHVVSDYKDIKDKLKGYELSFDDNSELLLSNHIFSLLKRIYNHELIEPIDEELMEGVSDDALSIAKNLFSGVFLKNDLALDKSEIFLVATHIELALERTGQKTEVIF